MTTKRISWKTTRCVLGKPMLRQLLNKTRPSKTMNGLHVFQPVTTPAGVMVYRIVDPTKRRHSRFVVKGRDVDVDQALNSCAHIQEKHIPITTPYGKTLPTPEVLEGVNQRSWRRW